MAPVDGAMMRPSLVIPLYALVGVLPACAGLTAGAPPTPETVPVVVPSAAVTPNPLAVAQTPAPRRTYALDDAAGHNGAPTDFNFSLPDAGAGTAVAGTLSDGSKGVTLTATSASDDAACTLPAPMGPSITVSARMKVAAVMHGSGARDGLQLTLRAYDDDGSPVPGSDGAAVVLQTVREPGAFGNVDGKGALPSGATRGAICVAFAGSTGRAEIDSLTVDGLLVEALPAGVGAGQPATPTVFPPPTVRVDLDSPGGGSGAPTGADFFLPTNATGVSATAGPIAGTRASGLTLEVTTPGDAMVCSQAFSVVPGAPLWAQGYARVRAVNADATATTGLVAEFRPGDATGKLGSAATALPLRVWKAATLGPDGAARLGPFGAEVTAPADSATGRVCLRFADATGAVDVDWFGLAEAAAPGAAVPNAPTPSATPGLPTPPPFTQPAGAPAGEPPHPGTPTPVATPADPSQPPKPGVPKVPAKAP